MSMTVIIIGALACISLVLAQVPGGLPPTNGDEDMDEVAFPKDDVGEGHAASKRNKRLIIPANIVASARGVGPGQAVILPGTNVRGSPKFFPIRNQLRQRLACVSIMVCTSDGSCITQEIDCNFGKNPSLVPTTPRAAGNPENPIRHMKCIYGGFMKDILCAAECRIKGQGSGYCTDNDVCMCVQVNPNAKIMPTTAATIYPPNQLPVRDFFCYTGDMAKNFLCATRCRLKLQGSGYCNDRICMCVQVNPGLGSATTSTVNPATDALCSWGFYIKDVLCAGQCRIKGQGSGYCTDEDVCMCVRLP